MWGAVARSILTGTSGMLTIDVHTSLYKTGHTLNLCALTVVHSSAMAGLAGWLHLFG